MKPLSYSKSAIKTLARMGAVERARIRAKVEQYADGPAGLANNVKALLGTPYVRLRVGDWRVIMDDRGGVIHVVKVGPRGGVYD